MKMIIKYKRIIQRSFNRNKFKRITINKKPKRVMMIVLEIFKMIKNKKKSMNQKILKKRKLQKKNNKFQLME